MKHGDIELFNKSKIFNLKVEGLENDPVFSADDLSRIYFNTTTNSYKFNNGQSYVDLSLPNNFSNFTDTLGTNWINSDLTFNPTAFNNLDNISNLTSDSTLFDVVAALDRAITALDAPSLADLTDVTIPDAISNGYVLYFDGTDYTVSSIDDIIANYSTIKVTSLKDVNRTIIDGGSLVYNQDTSQFDIKKTSIVFQDYTNSSSHPISHNLGCQYVSVTVINKGTNTSIPTATIEYIDENSLNINLNSPAPIVAIITVPYGS